MRIPWMVPVVALAALAGCFQEPAAGPIEAPSVMVNLVDNAFLPAQATVAVGQNVTFRHAGEAAHTVTIRTLDEGGMVFDVDDPGLRPGNMVVFSASVAGSYAVYCRYHGQGDEGVYDQGMVLMLSVSPT